MRFLKIGWFSGLSIVVLLGTLAYAVVAGSSAEETTNTDLLPPRQLKQGAIEALERLRISDPRLDKALRETANSISMSIADGDRSLFLDDSRILPAPQGEAVFDRELAAVGTLTRAMQFEDLPEGLDAEVQAVIDALVEADKGIVDTAMAAARALLEKGVGDPSALADAEDFYERALEQSEPAK